MCNGCDRVLHKGWDAMLTVTLAADPCVGELLQDSEDFAGRHALLFRVHESLCPIQV